MMRWLLMGFLLGTVAGLAVGMLIAPTRGYEVRQRLRERAQPAVERMRSRIRMMRQRAA
jgi:gas vesicle protein